MVCSISLPEKPMAKSNARPGSNSMKRRGSEKRGSSAISAIDIARHHGTRGNTPATTRTMKMTAAVTAQVSSEKRGDLGVFVVIDMVRAPGETGRRLMKLFSFQGQ